jgi:hypothetical protein
MPSQKHNKSRAEERHRKKQYAKQQEKERHQVNLEEKRRLRRRPLINMAEMTLDSSKSLSLNDTQDTPNESTPLTQKVIVTVDKEDTGDKEDMDLEIKLKKALSYTATVFQGFDTSPMGISQDEKKEKKGPEDEKLTSTMIGDEDPSELEKEMVISKIDHNNSIDDSKDKFIHIDEDNDDEGSSKEPTTKTLNRNMIKVMETLKDVKKEIMTSHDTQKKLDEKLDALETSMNAKINDLMKPWTTKVDEVNERAEHNKKIIGIQVQEAIIVKTTIEDQKKEMAQLREALELMNKKLDSEVNKCKKQIDLKNEEIKRFKDQWNLGDQKARKRADQALILANEIEIHNRRWAFRILGLEAPAKRETIKEAKEKVVEFLKTKLKLEHVEIQHVDCAHRVGPVTDKNKQTMLVRLYSRDNVDTILSVRKTLKDSGYIIYEDLPMITRLLINDLKKNYGLNSTWYSNGKVWVKKTATSEKFIIGITDNIRAVIDSK